MLDSNKLKAAIVEKGYSQLDMAKMLEITPKTFYKKMQTGAFGIDEAKKLINTLDIKNPNEIFLLIK